jgi:hypothetical protein
VPSQIGRQSRIRRAMIRTCAIGGAAFKTRGKPSSGLAHAFSGKPLVPSNRISEASSPVGQLHQRSDLPEAASPVDTAHSIIPYRCIP